MLMAEEFKKNISFFLFMALVLTLLMSAGISLFNFSFEINKKIYGQLEEHFEYGYEISIDDFLENTAEWRQNGVSYAYYGGNYSNVAGIEGAWITSRIYQFEDYMPKVFQLAMNQFDDFLISGSLWNAEDNKTYNGRHPIFLSDYTAAELAENGIDASIGSVIDLYKSDIISGVETDGEIKQFYIKGIYRLADLPYEWQWRIPDSVISINAELDMSQGGVWNHTTFILNNINDYKKFAAHAKKIGQEYRAGIENDIALVGLFSGIFITVSVIILSLSGVIAFVYCEMHINKRLNFIGLLKALGMKNSDISKQFFVLLLIVFAVAFVLGNIFSVLINGHFAYLALTLFDYNLNTGFNPLSQGIYAALTVLTVFLSVLLLNRRISKISVSRTLTQKE